MASAKHATGECYECKVCWYVYDPNQGDDVGQIPAGTSFAQLPETWLCPECDGPKMGFLPVMTES